MAWIEAGFWSNSVTLWSNSVQEGAEGRPNWVRSLLMTSKLLQKVSKMGPRNARMSKWRLKMRADEPQGGPGEPQEDPKWSPDASKKAQDGFNTRSEWAKIGPRGAKMA